MKFELIHNEKKARVGKIFTDNGEIETPILCLLARREV